MLSFENIANPRPSAAVLYELNEEESLFDPLRNTLSELNIVISDFLEINQEEESEDRDVSMFKNFYLRQNYLKILLEKISCLVEKQEEKWSSALEEKESLKTELEILTKTNSEYYGIYHNVSGKNAEYMQEISKLSEECNRLMVENQTLKEKTKSFKMIADENEQLKWFESPIVDDNQSLKEDNRFLKEKNDEVMGPGFFYSEAKILSLRTEFSELQTKYLELEKKSEESNLTIRNLERCKKNNELKIKDLEEKYEKLELEFEDQQGLLEEEVKKAKGPLLDQPEIIGNRKISNDLKVSGINDEKKPRRMPSLLEELGTVNSPLRSSMRSSRSPGYKAMNFKTFAFPEEEKKDYGRNLIENFNFEFFQGPDSASRQQEKKAIEKSSFPGNGKREKWDPYHDYFVLTCISAKLNSKYCDDIIDVKTDGYYEEVKRENLPFHKWPEFIDGKLNAHYFRRKSEERANEARFRKERELAKKAEKSSKKSFFKIFSIIS